MFQSRPSFPWLHSLGFPLTLGLLAGQAWSASSEPESFPLVMDDLKAEKLLFCLIGLGVVDNANYHWPLETCGLDLENSNLVCLLPSRCQRTLE